MSALSIYDNLISKMREHFGKESLIIFSKSCDYFRINQIKKDDIQMYYQYLISNNIQKEDRTINDIACCLYYLSKNNEEYQSKFISLIIEKLNISNDKINDWALVLIYNIIEFDEQYLKSDKNKIQYLLDYLERFSSHPKSRTNYLLFKYYRGCLKLNLGDIESANLEYLETVTAYTDEVIMQNKETKYSLYIKLKNDLLYVRIIKITQGDDIRQSRIFLKELYERTIKENISLAFIIGFELYDIYLKENKYNECLEILLNMKKLLKKKLLTGIKMNNAIDFYLAMISRLGYVSILTNNKNIIESTIKKLTKNSPMFSQFNESANDKNTIFKNAYSFLLTILKVNNKEKVEKQKEIAANFKSYFLPDLNSAKNNNFKNQFIITESNFYNCVVNLDIINNMDYETETFWKKNVYEPLLSVVSQNNPLQHSAVVTFILSIHKQINHLIESYCTDFYKDSYKNKIIELSEKTLAYVKNYYSDEFFFHTEFVKGALIDIISAYAHIFLYNKEYNKMKNVVIFFDELNKVLKFNENTPSYELICKIKGDYWLFSSFKDIKASLVFYEKALQLLPNHHPKKPIILFNMGYCHFVNDNKKMAMEYLNRCVSEFNSVDLTKSPFDFYCRPNALSKKVNIAKRMISLMLENE